MKFLFIRVFIIFIAFIANVSAQSQPYPNKPIKIISPFATGGIADTFSRVVGQGLSESLGQPVVVENKTGGGGNIGADFVAKAPADGYTLVMGNIGSHAVNPYLIKNMPYDPLKDFEPVAYVLDAEGLLVVNPTIPVKNVTELIAYVKARPGQVSYGSGGMGTTSHLAGELFKSLAKVDMTHIPYKGNAPAITDLIGGQTQVMFATMPTVLPYVKTDKLKALAVIGSSRASSLPEVPTVAETLPGFDVSNWIGIFAPAGTPKPIINKLNAEIIKIMQQPAVQKRLETEGAKFKPMTPEAFGAFQKNEALKWAKTIKDSGIKPE
ncbi:tripartite tricarboxylate transporter substrate binding protein [Polynucleobacter sp. IMCC 29146]|uniref:Bug family tripartite tricarboxylate transporter substrate binding protein n=1 Tax=Polynucleobacter sp. IMCC 29146 TaxID=2780953 RepID=UPI001F452078|nr:tripartite tricarboxylate transporter substrate binding protein [Polynucleobacter sp. IMCC 29146]MCE7529063.1 tripartite tricarboxylate transporter substrate binding protein [Polynucleobacter sp. IMCC 29146]